MKVYARIDAVASGAVSPAPAPVQTAPSVTASSAAAAAPSTADLDALRSELKALRETINATRTGADTAASRADAARTQATEALGEARNAVARAAQADKALTGLVSRAEFERQGVQLQKLQTELSELRGQVKSLADKPAAPAGDAKPALEQRINRDITALRAENTRLQNEVSRLLKAVSESRVDTLRIAGACSLVAFVLALAASMFVK